jgi:hypothetical protein
MYLNLRFRTPKLLDIFLMHINCHLPTKVLFGLLTILPEQMNPRFIYLLQVETDN